jgi:prepilin-type N-terminal cleavage/methylation domain-containing protein
MRRMTRHARAGGAGFSLIELLVVISIIAVLIALLLPALAGSQEQARRLKCLTQTGQVGKAMHVYANNSRDWLPVMAVPPSLPLIENQWRYGGLAGLFSLRQVGDGSLGFGGSSATGLPYSDGNTEPLLASYVSTFEVLKCPSDREDRYYGDPYSPLGNTSYAAAQAKQPHKAGRREDAISYNISYAYIAGYQLSRVVEAVSMFGDETNGPDLGILAGYGAGQVPSGASTPNSSAAGAAAAGMFAPVDNHKQHGGNLGNTDGSGTWVQAWWAPRRPRTPIFIID